MAFRLLLALLALPAAALALPDLRPELYGVRIEAGQTVGAGDVAEGCAGATTGRLLLRFGIRFHNDGAEALVIGDPRCPDCAANPGALCSDARFICSPADGHNHPHFLNWTQYVLLDMAGNLVRLGGKKSFCVRDNRCATGVPGFSCTNQGLSPGCVDDYDPSLGCQYIDVTDVPDARTRAFRLRAELDPDGLVPDADAGNNVTEIVIPGCGDGVVGGDEACDPGATPRDPCCGDDCRLAPPGSACQTPPGPCGRPDDPAADGAACGSGIPPCLSQVCRAGVCVGQTTDAGCLIGAACVAPGAVDAVNACQRCDPSARVDGWSLNHDPDVDGLRCQVGRVSGAMVGVACHRGLVRALARPLARLGVLLDRRAGATGVRARRLDRRLAHQIARLADAQAQAAGIGCTVDGVGHEVDALAAQFQAFRALATGR